MTIATETPENDIQTEQSRPVAPDCTGVLTIDIQAIRKNYNALNSVVGNAECAAVVKADAYGLGVSRVVPALTAEGCTTFFVATIDEAREVRALNDRATIYVLNGLAEGAAPILARLYARPVLASMEEIQEWATYCTMSQTRLPAAIQLDTGMNRLGLNKFEIELLAGRPDLFERFDCCLILSHLACGESPNHPLNQTQHRLFTQLQAKLPPVPASLANSAGIILGQAYHFDLVRPGIALFGGRALAKGTNPLMPVVKLEARVLQIRDADKDETVSYGAERTLGRQTKIATIALGYADGFIRELGKSDSQPPATLFFDDYPAPLLGRVSMDLICVDITDIPEGIVKRGSMAEVIGPNMSLDEVASRGHTIGYEILTSLGKRYQRKYIGG